ncbi:hypothetical protein SPHINGOT1_130014 [Sphingomonas sp. T1]|nr:hypothetical protein SPHINGOT1_130014 [Sphingomonas sp. T1]
MAPPRRGSKKEKGGPPGPPFFVALHPHRVAEKCIRLGKHQGTRTIVVQLVIETGEFDELDLAARPLQPRCHQPRFVDADISVAVAVEHQDGRGDPVGMARGRSRLDVRTATDKGVDHRITGKPARFLAKCIEIGHRRDRDDRLEQPGFGDRRLQRGIAAIGPADDRQRGGRGNSLCDQPAAGIVDIADRGAPRLEAVLLEPGRAIARRAAEIGLKHGKAARGEELREPVEPPFVARARPAMRHHNRGQPLAAAAGGQRQIARDHCPVGRAKADRLDAAERDAGELRARRHHLAHFPGLAVEQVIAAGIDVAAREQQQRVLIRTGIDERHDRLPRQRRVERRRQRAQRRIEERHLAPIGRIGGTDHAALPADADQAVDIDIGVGQHELALERAVQRDLEQRLAAILVVKAIGDVERRIDGIGIEPGTVLIALQPAQRQPGAIAGLPVQIVGPPGFVAGVASAAQPHDPHHASTVADILVRRPARRLDRPPCERDAVDPFDAQALAAARGLHPGRHLGHEAARHQHRAGDAVGGPVDHAAAVLHHAERTVVGAGAEHLHRAAVAIDRDRPAEADQPETALRRGPDLADHADVGGPSTGGQRFGIPRRGQDRLCHLARGHVRDPQRGTVPANGYDHRDMRPVGRQAHLLDRLARAERRRHRPGRVRGARRRRNPHAQRHARAHAHHRSQPHSYPPNQAPLRNLATPHAMTNAHFRPICTGPGTGTEATTAGVAHALRGGGHAARTRGSNSGDPYARCPSALAPSRHRHLGADRARHLGRNAQDRHADAVVGCL